MPSENFSDNTQMFDISSEGRGGNILMFERALEIISLGRLL